MTGQRTERARCSNCGHAYAKRNLKASNEGGAVCKDWFRCQQRRDARIRQTRRPRLP